VIERNRLILIFFNIRIIMELKVTERCEVDSIAFRLLNPIHGISLGACNSIVG
jgi:hypothetical protein